MRIARHRRFTANHTWHLDWRGRRYFVKLMPNRLEAAAEVAGHGRISSLYPVPRLYAHRVFGTFTMLVYQRHGADVPDSGLLVDEINLADRTASTDRLDDCLNQTIAYYRSSVDSTLVRVPLHRTMGKLYGDRARPGGRLDSYYGTDQPLLRLHDGAAVRPSDLRRLCLVVNGREYRLDFDSIVRAARDYFTPTRMVWAAQTQGDPTDLNIGTEPVWFDYDTAGLNALAGEVACFLWYQYLQGGWLVPTYNPAAYIDHPATLAARELNRPIVHIRRTGRWALVIDHRHRPSEARRHVINRYHSALVSPLADRVGVTDLLEWLRPYLVMRILGVYNLGGLATRDAALSLALLAEVLSDESSLHQLLELPQ